MAYKITTEIERQSYKGRGIISVMAWAFDDKKWEWVEAKLPCDATQEEINEAKKQSIEEVEANFRHDFRWYNTDIV